MLGQKRLNWVTDEPGIQYLLGHSFHCRGNKLHVKLSSVYTLVTSQVNSTFWTKPKIVKFVVPFARVICEIFYIPYHMQRT